MHYKHFAAGCLLFAGTLLSCKKEKVDFQSDNRYNTEAYGNSLVRLVNLRGNGQLVINGDSLTNFIVYPPLPGGGVQPTPGTKWFPSTGHMGTTYVIPRQFIVNGKAFVQSVNLTLPGMNVRADSVGFHVEERNNAPMDYFIVDDFQAEQEVDRVMEVPRDITSPAKPGHFKIRIVNIADKLVQQSDPVEDISKPLSLAFADGTLVSTHTNNVGVRRYSEYVELPFGTYQFKVLTPEGTEVNATGGNNFEGTKVIDPATSQITRAATGVPHTVVTGLTYAPLRSYKPGGIYTIVVYTSRMTVPYYMGNPGETGTVYQNSFRVLADISEPENNNYFRLQGVHAITGEAPLSFRVNGNKLGDLAYGAHTDYGVYVYGKATLEAVNAQGNVIASMEMDALPNLNYTAWLYKKADGAAAIALVNNNLSGNTYRPGNTDDGQDGQFSQVHLNYPFQARFLNLCADLPYASFTGLNGQPLSTAATRNLQPGQVALHLPYATIGGTGYGQPAQLMVFRSSPGVYPGNWLPEIPVLKGADFVARPEHYTRPVKPVNEPGVYTVALIGQLAGTGNQKAKMIIVKHTK